MLPREMVRQAVLIAARDELGLATRDQVIDETSADGKEAGAGTVEVVSFIRDNRSREQIRRLDEGKIETLFAHETPTAPGMHLELNKLLASAEVLSREQFPGRLRGPASVEPAKHRWWSKERVFSGSRRPAWQLGVRRRSAGRARAAQGDPVRRRVAGARGGTGEGLCLARCTQRTRMEPGPPGVQSAPFSCAASSCATRRVRGVYGTAGFAWAVGSAGVDYAAEDLAAGEAKQTKPR